MVGAEALSTNPNPNQTCLESEILQVATLQVQKSKSDFRVPNRMETIKPHPGRSLPVPNTLSDLQNTRNHLAQLQIFGGHKVCTGQSEHWIDQFPGEHIKERIFLRPFHTLLHPKKNLRGRIRWPTGHPASQTATVGDQNFRTQLDPSM